VNGALTKRGHQFLRRDFLPFQVFFHEDIIVFTNSFQQKIAMFAGPMFFLSSQFPLVKMLAHVVFIYINLFLYKVDNPGKTVFRTDRKLNGNRITS